MIELDCGDNSCHFAKPSNRGGMRTNGGCRCFEQAGFTKSSVASAYQMLPKYLRMKEALGIALGSTEAHIARAAKEALE